MSAIILNPAPVIVAAVVASAAATTATNAIHASANPPVQKSEPAAPNRPPKKQKAPRRKRSAAAPKAVNEFAGLTVSDCPAACHAAGACIISGSICAHPRKGGLQARLQNAAALERLNKAQKMLGKRTMDIR